MLYFPIYSNLSPKVVIRHPLPNILPIWGHPRTQNAALQRKRQLLVGSLTAQGTAEDGLQFMQEIEQEVVCGALITLVRVILGQDRHISIKHIAQNLAGKEELKKIIRKKERTRNVSYFSSKAVKFKKFRRFYYRSVIRPLESRAEIREGCRGGMCPGRQNER